jgi:hypothetical protein
LIRFTDNAEKYIRYHYNSVARVSGYVESMLKQNAFGIRPNGYSVINGERCVNLLGVKMWESYRDNNAVEYLKLIHIDAT